MITKGLSRIAIAALGAAVLLAGCSGQTADTGKKADPAKSAQQPPKEELKPVELTWYYAQPKTQPDLAVVNEAVNKIVKEKINATVKLQPIDFGNYEQKMNTIIASGEEFDIAWTSSWNFKYSPAAAKGAFVELEGLLDKYAPNLKKSMPPLIWDGARVNGKLYAVPNYQTITTKSGFMVQKRFADKYKLDPKAIKKFEDIEPFLAQVKANEKDIIPFGMDRNGVFPFVQSVINLEAVQSNLYGVRANDKELKVVNFAETPEYKTYLSTVRSWYQKGYINQDSATVKNVNDILKVGNVAVRFHNKLKPGGEIDELGRNGKQDVVFVPVMNPIFNPNSATSTLNAISRTSKNQERAMMLLELVNSNKELYNLLSFGIEGKHYTKEGNVVEVKADSAYNPNSDWVFGNQFNAFIRKGQPADIWEATKKENETATPMALSGFNFNPEPVTAEIANTASVTAQYIPVLDTGSVDQSEKLQEFQTKLKQAGADKIMAEIQKQIDEWKKSKK